MVRPSIFSLSILLASFAVGCSSEGAADHVCQACLEGGGGADVGAGTGGNRTVDPETEQDAGGQAGGPSQGTELPEACGSVDGEMAQALVLAGEATLVDVRTPGEYAEAHLPDAVNIPLDELSSRWGELPPGEPVITYCRSGGRSVQASALLCDVDVHVLDLGAMANYPQ